MRQQQAKPNRQLPPVRIVTRPVFAILEAFPDGWISVYGPRHLRVFAFTHLDYRHPDKRMQAKMLEAAMQYHDMEMPQRYREHYFPSSVRATHLTRPRTFASELARLERLEDLRFIQRLCEARRP